MPDYEGLPRQSPPVLPIARRVGIAEIEGCYSEVEARKESSRCLRCWINTVFEENPAQGTECILCGACADVCPDEAIHKRDDGIVVMDYNRCTGCQACIAECPYDAIAYDHHRNIASKCNLCHHRIDNGLIPACADNVCLAHCIIFEAAT